METYDDEELQEEDIDDIDGFEYDLVTVDPQFQSYSYSTDEQQPHGKSFSSFSAQNGMNCYPTTTAARYNPPPQQPLPPQPRMPPQRLPPKVPMVSRKSSVDSRMQVGSGQSNAAYRPSNQQMLTKTQSCSPNLRPNYGLPLQPRPGDRGMPVQRSPSFGFGQTSPGWNNAPTAGGDRHSQVMSPRQPQAMSPRQPQAMSPRQPQAMSPRQPQAMSPRQPQAMSPRQPWPLSPGQAPAPTPGYVSRRSSVQDSLVNAPWYHGPITRETAQNRLQKMHQEESFLVRNARSDSVSENHGPVRHLYTLSLFSGGKIFNVRIKSLSGTVGGPFIIGNGLNTEQQFASLSEMILYFESNHLLLENGSTVLLKWACPLT